MHRCRVVLRIAVVVGIVLPVVALPTGATGASGSAASEVDGVDLGSWVASAPLAFAGATPIHFTVGVATSGGEKLPKLLSFTVTARCKVVPGSDEPNPPPDPSPRILTFTWKDTPAYDEKNGPVTLNGQPSYANLDTPTGAPLAIAFRFPSAGTATGNFDAQGKFNSGAYSWGCASGVANNSGDWRVPFTAHHVS